MPLQIRSGRIARPQKVVLYAPEGIGKSTLASQLEKPLFLDFEQGSHQLDVDRIEPATFAETLSILSEIAKAPPSYKTLVIDTIDWLEEAAITHLCKEHKKSGIEDFGYGKGFVYLAEQVTALLSRLDAVARAGLHVVLLAHSEVKRVELPDLPPFDRYQLRLTKQVMPLVKEWCDALLFGSYKIALREPDSGKTKAVGGRERLLRCAHSATADAKNRHGLKDEEPWGVATMMKILGQPTAVIAPEPEAPKPAAVQALSPLMKQWSDVRSTLDADTLLAVRLGEFYEFFFDEAQIVGKVLNLTVTNRGGNPMAGFPYHSAQKSFQRLVGAGFKVAVLEDTKGTPAMFQSEPEDKIPGIENPPARTWRDDVERVLEPYREAASRWLIEKGKITEGQPFGAMPQEFGERILKNPAKFIETIGAKGGAA